MVFQLVRVRTRVQPNVHCACPHSVSLCFTVNGGGGFSYFRQHAVQQSRARHQGVHIDVLSLAFLFSSVFFFEFLESIFCKKIKPRKLLDSKEKKFSCSRPTFCLLYIRPRTDTHHRLCVCRLSRRPRFVTAKLIHCQDWFLSTTLCVCCRVFWFAFVYFHLLHPVGLSCDCQVFSAILSLVCVCLSTCPDFPSVTRFITHIVLSSTHAETQFPCAVFN